MADVVALAVTSVPGVTGLHPGAFGEVATYLPGRRVNGIRLTDDLAEVHVRLLMGTDLLPTAHAIRAVVEPIVGTEVHVYIEDIDPAVDAGVAVAADRTQLLREADITAPAATSAAPTVVVKDVDPA